MAFYYSEPSRTFSEYLLLPNKTTKSCTPDNVALGSPLARFKKGERSPLSLNIPFASAIMQAVSDHNLAIELARCGGVSFIFSSQSIDSQVDMVRRVKKFKAGFVVSDANIRPDQPLRDVVALTHGTGHSTIPVTSDGTSRGKLVGILTSRDFRIHKCDLNAPVKDFMTPFAKLVYGVEGIALGDANDMIWDHKLNCLPIVDDDKNLRYLVFRKDYDEHKENPSELVDNHKRLVVGAGINTHDFRDRVPALVDAEVDVMCVDSSDGFSEWQFEAIQWVKKSYGPEMLVGAGNVVDEEGFRYLVEAGADFVKVGVGPASICITREQKGIGRGQATALIEVAQARSRYFEETGVYVPLCSDGGIVQDYHIVLALAMGAEFVMQGRYYARFDESPGRKIRVRGNFMKEYWGEGSDRARNWQRYAEGGANKLSFEEGVDAYVPYAGRLKDNVALTVAKMKATMCNCGSTTIPELQETARLTLVSATSIREGGVHDVVLKESDFSTEQ